MSKEFKMYLNRELSWLAFEDRIHEEVTRSDLPLLERVRFLSIASSNLDEFFMVRVAGLRNQVRQGITKLSIDGQTPSEQLQKIRDKTKILYNTQQKLWYDLQGELNNQNIFVVRPRDLLTEDQAYLKQVFKDEIFPSLTPLAIDSLRPFPNIANDGLVVVFELIIPYENQKIIALVPIPDRLNRFVHLQRADGDYFIAIEDLIIENFDILFSDSQLESFGAFHLVRDTGLEMNDEADDLIMEIREHLRHRAFGNVVRLFILDGMPDYLRDFIVEHLCVESFETYMAQYLLDISDIKEITNISHKDLLFKPTKVRFPKVIKTFDYNYFSAISAEDFLVHHPYESFDVVVDFLQQAADDPDVISIRQTLYRTSDDSPIVAALCLAAQQGKSVTAIIEIKARFNEQSNLELAQKLERSGAKVVYGFTKVKIHAKLSMVTRREKGSLKSYCHVGTGNYHPQNAKIYTDFSIFSCDPHIATDVTKVFNFVTGYAIPQDLQYLAVSPFGLQKMILERLNAEIAHAERSEPAHVWLKINNLVSPPIIKKLYEASQAGVKIELLVRSICCLRPNVAGLSENITVRSLVGRFLEHSRLYCFGNGHSIPHDNNVLYVASADLMPRNLERRVEVAMPILTKSVRNQLLHQIIYAYKQDTEQSWFMQADGTYVRDLEHSDPFNAQKYFMSKKSLSGIADGKKTKRKKIKIPLPSESIEHMNF